jgi:hypothetical protein
MATLIGSGRLYDEDENELSTVAYRIEHDADEGELIVAWAGEINVDAATDVVLEPGRYLLVLEDGTRGGIEVEPAGAASAGEGQIAFTGATVIA